MRSSNDANTIRDGAQLLSHCAAHAPLVRHRVEVAAGRVRTYQVPIQRSKCRPEPCAVHQRPRSQPCHSRHIIHKMHITSGVRKKLSMKLSMLATPGGPLTVCTKGNASAYARRSSAEETKMPMASTRHPDSTSSLYILSCRMSTPQCNWQQDASSHLHRIRAQEIPGMLL